MLPITASSNSNKTTRAMVAFVLVALVILGLFGTHQSDKPVRSFKSASVNSPKTDLDEKVPARVDASGHPFAENEIVNENNEAPKHSVVEDVKKTPISPLKKDAADISKADELKSKTIKKENALDVKHIVEDNAVAASRYSVAMSKTFNHTNIRLVFDGPNCKGSYARVEVWYNDWITHTDKWGVLADCRISSMPDARQTDIVSGIARQVGYSSGTYVSPSTVTSGFVTAPPHRYHVEVVTCAGQSSFCGTCFGFGAQFPCLGLRYSYNADIYVSVGKTLPKNTICEPHETAADLYRSSRGAHNATTTCRLLNPFSRSGAVSMQGINAVLVALVALVWWN